MLISLTDAFVKARYSRHDISPGEASMVKAAWTRIRRALQAKIQNEAFFKQMKSGPLFAWSKSEISPFHFYAALMRP